MFRRLLVLFFAVLFVSVPVHGFADESPKILVLPFDVYSDKDLSYLSTQVPAIIAGQLEKDGGKIIDSSSFEIEKKDEVYGIDMPLAKSLGTASDADYVLWGSFTRTLKKISLDVRLINLKKQDDTEYVHAEGDDIENLLSTVNSVTNTLGTYIFRIESISEIEIRGSVRIEPDAILNVIRTKTGDRYQKSKLSDDLKRVFAMGYFDDVRIEADRSDLSGTLQTKIIFTVEEKPTVRRIKISGNKALQEDTVMKEVTITEGSILNSAKIKANIRQIEALYSEKHYHNTKVSYKTYPLDNNQAELVFIVEEGDKVAIKEIHFVGNRSYKEKQLKKLMRTKRKGFFSWLTSSGSLNTSDLNMDIASIGADYQKNGYIDVKIGEPEIKYDGKWIFITIKIDEGVQYKRGNVDVTGDLVESKEVLISKLAMPKETVLNKEVLQKDVITLSDVCSDKGYASVNINPRIDRNEEEKTADVVYDIQKGNLVYFDRIIIGGNSVTRDKVIRRQIQVYEQELFNGSRLKRSVRNLYRMGYFEDVKIDTLQGSESDTMNLVIDVKEKPTGTFTFGMGYSSESKFFGTVGVAKKNLFGRDQSINIQGEFGDESNKYSISFLEPWLFDIPLSFQVEIMDWKREYDYYDKKTLGGSLRFGYPVFDYTRLYLGYSYEVNDIRNISLGAEQAAWILAGENVTQSVTATLHYDSRDRAYNAQPTDGADCAFSIKYAGGPLGGDISFTKYKLILGRYTPLIEKFIGYAHAEGGYVRQNSGGLLPPYEKFFLGGMNSVRGFDYADICLYDENGFEEGGLKYMQYNVELLRPLFNTEGFLGLAFFDMGNVYPKDSHYDFGELRKSWGFGVRWFSPIGPIRFERGYIIDPKEGEPKSGKWGFTMGGTF